MGLLDIFRRSTKSPLPSSDVPDGDWHVDGAWLRWPAPYNVIREGYYREAIVGLCGGRCEGGYLIPVTVTLAREPANRYDPNAVTAHVRGVHVGYLHHELAARAAATVDGQGIRSWRVPGVIRANGGIDDPIGLHVWINRPLESGPSFRPGPEWRIWRWPPERAELDGARRSLA